MGGIIYSVLAKYSESRVRIAEAAGIAAAFIAEHTEMNRQILTRLEVLDGKLSAVERTLTDIH
ncbi:hypothetical protein [Cryobacterium sp. TMT3-29-2]|uniref:hypothetical protein n=1 Tax=Cryobacterium sp. TMT3-29-2 TaxID=2555867 RepID=UPI0011001EDF|nr:hypothetical protein [Cryobacterium sp. TMT3-29-2]TFC93251.1 hypothetical protein E3O67_02310 [Cryobacterium sp. TMT3-29-2]